MFVSESAKNGFRRAFRMDGFPITIIVGDYKDDEKSIRGDWIRVGEYIRSAERKFATTCGK